MLLRLCEMELLKWTTNLWVACCLDDFLFDIVGCWGCRTSCSCSGGVVGGCFVIRCKIWLGIGFVMSSTPVWLPDMQRSCFGCALLLSNLVRLHFSSLLVVALWFGAKYDLYRICYVIDTSVVTRYVKILFWMCVNVIEPC